MLSVTENDMLRFDIASTTANIIEEIYNLLIIIPAVYVTSFIIILRRFFNGKKKNKH